MIKSDLNKNIIEGPAGTFFEFSDDNFNGDYLKEEVIDFIKQNRIEKAIILEKSEFSPIAVTIKTTNFLKQVNWLKYLSLINFQMELKGIQYLNHIEKLYIGSTSDEIDFSSNKKLKDLSITYNKKRNSIFELINLEKLLVWSFSFSDLIPLKNLLKLRELELITTPIKNLNGIENLENLEKLEICYSRNLADLSDLIKSKSLKKIRFQNCPNLLNLRGIYNNKQLEFISFDNCKNLIITDEIFNLENIEILSICDTISLQSINKIKNLKKLKRLIIRSKISDNDLTPILELKNLEFISIPHKKGYNLTESEIKKQLNISEPDYKLILQKQLEELKE